MQKMESLTDFYKEKMRPVPEGLGKSPEHFNVMRWPADAGQVLIPPAFSRKDFYKIKLIMGKTRCHYADKTITITDSALLFASPYVPYQLERLEESQHELFCIFTESFFHQFGNIKAYPVFNPQHNPVYFPTPAEVVAITAIYQRMETELHSDYAYKYDVLRTLVYELVHTVMKMQPAPAVTPVGAVADARIAALFMELLELQFPVNTLQAVVNLRRPRDFAACLSVHVNHLNRAVKNTTGKTTSACIAARLLQEAKVLLKHTQWSVAEITYCLGFESPSHFNRFFREQVSLTPGMYRAQA
ncbi:helix-turn-helix domain-containing protein [Chitinophaga nivalis]|uniref:Helix-turn-helix transcriptional regulator n=1 Tax=Chitinophaga nivalis TaxID=2991709 RepID=A0ABT3IJE4_9BACT|nr:helix-turn-helix transcriptional regulator [Chitinophaga nivalis]MCW3466245.1 helix-turn-helix transcriptional regulator [Chitinophaga nivalis]MCW3484064.1 helix-turn-helix transcriptional regulator [Chitinophaga nivalis]